MILVNLSCSPLSKLNTRINDSQKNSLIDSPFRTAQSMRSELKAQLKFRRSYLSDLKCILKRTLNDTIFLTERYDYICFGCAAMNTSILIDSMLYSFNRDFDGKTYQCSSIQLTSKFTDFEGQYYDDIGVFISQIKRGEPWNNDPLKYGTNNCFDGDHTFFTVIFPSGKSESMYIRCLIPMRFRTIAPK
jgi:hypothetical protein